VARSSTRSLSFARVSHNEYDTLLLAHSLTLSLSLSHSHLTMLLLLLLLLLL